MASFSKLDFKLSFTLFIFYKPGLATNSENNTSPINICCINEKSHHLYVNTVSTPDIII